MRNGKSVATEGKDSEVRCLSLASVRNGSIDVTESRYVPLDATNAKPYLVQDRDVFIVRGNGNRGLVGRAGMVAKTTPGLIFPDLLIRMSIPSEIIPEFFVLAWNSPAVRTQLEAFARTTSGIWKVNQQHLADTRIPVPSRTEQLQLVGKLREVQASYSKLEQLQRETQAEMQALLSALVDRAFSSPRRTDDERS